MQRLKKKTNCTGLGSGSSIVATIENRKRLYPSPGGSRKQQIITAVSLLRCLYNAKLTQFGYQVMQLHTGIVNLKAPYSPHPT